MSAAAGALPLEHAGQAGGNAVHVYGPARIPVRNLWLLMLYASDLFREKDLNNAGAEENPDDLPDLVAELLTRHAERRLRRNLSSDYRTREKDLSRLRGRIDLLDTERRGLLNRGKISCRFDELTVDTPRNRYVRAALETLAGLAGSDPAARCRSLAAVMRRMGVTGPRPERGSAAFGTIDRFGRHDEADRPMVAAAHLAFDLAIPTEQSGKHRLPQPDRDNKHWLRRLFERGVGGFYDVVLGGQGWHVRRGEHLYWQHGDKSEKLDEVLPGMVTDIILENPARNRRLVIDTKFTSILKSGWYRDSTLKSQYIYQMYAYLRSQENPGKPDDPVNKAGGLFLHPCTGDSFRGHVEIQGHKISFATVNLAGSAADIRRELLEVAGAKTEI
ncbi:MAG: 5-methylcytosine-specific restriction endonuclease system specificity protein McrC [Desulfovibrionaceae bacterium]|nr:5-methylcytosine-specific restriction endonuclease system specificity protein McrC [Desulfovibrionaceae bacterium]